LAVAAMQAWLTLGLFSVDHSLSAMLDARPILSGRHPLHLYHGCLGAKALLTRGTPSCFDPAFQAGYPKTPVFDEGSRPAELMLAFCGGDFRPDVYKCGLAGLCLAAPFLILLAARGAGLNRFRACLTAALGLLVWWGRPCRELLAAGDVALLLGALAAAVHFGLLLRYHRAPGPLSLLGASAAAGLGWFAHPPLMILTLPIFLLFYLTVGARRRFSWHVALGVGLATAAAANYYWLPDWVKYWWLRTPVDLTATSWPRDAWRALSASPAWGEAPDRTLALFLLSAGIAGAWFMHRGGMRPAARVFGLGAAILSVAAAGAVVWSPMECPGLARLLPAALLFTLPLAAHGLMEALQPVRRWLGWGGAGLAVVAALAALTIGLSSHRTVWEGRLRGGEPLSIGLDPGRAALVAAVAANTDADGRILWEDRRGPQWTALLPLLTGRTFVGGLDPEAGIEHTAGSLLDDALAGRPLEDWTDAELSDYCRRLNIRWVVCWSERTANRFARWGEAAPATDLGHGGRLFPLNRASSYTLIGAAHWRSADASRVVLTDVKPEGGQVVLSLHYQAGLRATPSRVRVERQICPDDAVGLVRFVMDGPAPVVTLTWERR
jgi:hypothetical protein